METTIERIEREAEKYSLDHQYVFAKRYWSDGAKSERNTTIDEVIERVRQSYLEDSPLWNVYFDKIISDLNKMKL